MSCFYCNGAVVPANHPEHSVPRAIGNFRGFQPLVGKICPDCNTRIGGRLDGRLARRGPESFFRILLGVEARHQDGDSPFYGVAFGGEPLRILAPLPDAHDPSYQVLWEVLPGARIPPDVREARQVVLRKQDGTVLPIAIPDRMRTAEDFEAHLRERNLGDVQLDRLIGQPEEQVWLEALAARLPRPPGAGPLDWFKPTLAAERVQLDMLLEVVYDELYVRAIAKIAFHYALTCFPEFTGSERGFEGIKGFIRNGGRWRDHVRLVSDGNVLQGRGGPWRQNRWLHALSATRANRRVEVRLQLFLGPGYSPPLFIVSVGTHDLVIIPPREAVGHALVFFFPDAPEPPYHGETEEMVAVNQNGLIQIPDGFGN